MQFKYDIVPKKNIFVNSFGTYSIVEEAIAYARDIIKACETESLL